MARRHLLTWFILLCGSVLFASTLNIVIASFIHFSQDRPDWVQQQQPLFTVGSLSPNGTLEPISRQSLQSISQLPNLTQMAIIGQGYANEFRIGEQSIRVAPVFYSPEFFQMLLPQSRADSMDLEGVWLSQSFWRETLKSSDLTGKTLNITDSELTLPIAGVLPADITLPQPLSNSILLPIDLHKNLLKVNFQTPMPPAILDQVKTMLSAQAAQFYGVFTTKNRQDPEYLQHLLSEKQLTSTTTSELTLYSRELPWQLVSGLVLQPEQKKALKQLIIMCGYLCLAIGIIVFLSLLSFFWNNMVSRQQEFEVRIAVGATVWQIFLQLFKEQIVFLCLLLCISILVMQVSEHLVLQPLIQQKSQHHLANILSGLLTFTALLSIFGLCLLVPLYSMLQKNIFNRDRSGQLTPTQRLFINGNMQLQVIVTLLLFSWGYAFFLSSLKLKHSSNIDTGMLQVSIIGDGNKLGWRTIEQHLKQTSFYNQVGLISDKFVEPEQLTASVSTLSANDAKRVTMPAYFVSANFFQVLGLTDMAMQTNEVWINKAAAQRLQQGSEDVGQIYIKDNPLEVSDAAAGIVVKKIVTDLPHFGVLKSNTPTIYFPYQQANSIFSDVSLIYPKQYQAQLEQFFAQLKRIYGHDMTIIQQGSIAQQLSKSHALEILLMDTLLLFALLMVLIVAFSFYSLVDAEVRRQRVSYGVMQAVGATRIDLLVMQYGKLLPLLAVASVVWFVIASYSQDWLASHFATQTLSLRNYLVSIQVLILTVLLSCTIPILQTQRVQISAQLRPYDE